MSTNKRNHWLRNLAKTIRPNQRGRKGWSNKSRSLRLERLEDRTVPTTYTVTTTTDFAIPDANTNVSIFTGQIQGTGTGADGQVTLRSAVIASTHGTGSSNTINLPAGTYLLT